MLTWREYMIEELNQLHQTGENHNKTVTKININSYSKRGSAEMQQIHTRVQHVLSNIKM